MTQNGPRPIRILVLRGVDGSGGGADKIILRTAHALEKERFYMQLCFMRHVNDDVYDFDTRSRKLGLNYAEIIHRHPLDLRVKPGIEKIISDFQPDIVHSHDYKANFFNWRISKKSNFKTLATSHGWTGHGFRERYIYYPADKRILRNFDRVIAVSDEIRKTLIDHGADPGRVQVVLNGVDAAEFQPDEGIRKQTRSELGIADRRIVLGAVGRIEKQKRFDILLKALQLIVQNRPDVLLLIAGEGSLSAEIEELISKMSLNERCRMLGHCEDMRKIYQAFDMLVQSSDYEGTPTVVVEAMAMGIPVVATDAGGTSQLITDRQHGLIVPCRSPERLAEAINETLDDSNATEQRIKNARGRVESELSYENRMRTLQSIYEELSRM